jgi:NTP pyrophosphatase (non-canonical NTP hydrolase)
MARFATNDSLADYQKFVQDVYGLPDDRLYSIWDILTQQQRFTMRALKGIRKNDTEKVRTNLLIAFSWLMAIANRLHISMEDEVWQRFPYLCSYCGRKPCSCKTIKPSARLKVKSDPGKKPLSLEETQIMFQEIYPEETRTLADAGVHLAEEMGEVSEAVHNYLGQHLLKQFDEVRLEMADFVSCIFGIANSADINIAKELASMFSDNCHVCHKAPCICKFADVVQIAT